MVRSSTAARFRAGNASSVALLDVNGPVAPVALFGAASAGIPYVSLNSRLTRAEINELVTGGTLAPNKANPLLTKLDQVVDKLDGGQTTAACGQLGSFINQVNAYISNGTLTAAQGQALIDATNDIRANIGC